MRQGLVLTMLALAVVVTGGCASGPWVPGLDRLRSGPLSAGGKETPGEGWIAFASSRDEGMQIYLVRPDGSELTQVTKGPGLKADASWSPDGKRIVFASLPDEPISSQEKALDLYVVNRDGSGLVRLTDSPGHGRQPAWSPDGGRIAFASKPEGEAWNIYVMDADGGRVRRLTSAQADAGEPTWSPDGKKIAFSLDGHWDGDHEAEVAIWVMRADGKGQRLLTDTPGMHLEPAWSPDGTKIAFVSNRDDGDWEIYVMNADGSGQTRLTYSPDLDISPAWSPDGKRIAFMSTRDGDDVIYVMNADGSGQTPLTDGDDIYPAWGP